MINVNRLYKAGRETKIFEIVDRLSINDFYNKTGYQDSTSIHGRMSRIKLTIVDVIKGTKSNANVGEFNFTTNEWNKNFKLLLNQELFKKHYPKKEIKISKANPYKKNGDLIEVKTICISLEDGLRIGVRWKFEIVTGTAKHNDGEFGYISETFKKLKSTNFLLSPIEVKDMVSHISNYIELWESNSFSEFMINKKAFIKRCAENNYDESTMNVWNKNPNSENFNNFNTSKVNNNNSKVAQSNSINVSNNLKKQKQQGVLNLPNSQHFSCAMCGSDINESTHEITNARFGKPLCQDCLVATISK